MSDPTLRFELEWVDKNSHLYNSRDHAENVMHNIRLNYAIRSLEKSIQMLKGDRRYENLTKCN